MPGLKGQFEAIAKQARASGESLETYLLACLSAEIDSRRQHRLASRIKIAKFPQAKTLDEFDFSLVPSLSKEAVLSLAAGDFVGAKENVVCLGASGTGKTHVAIAIGLAVIYAGSRVRFTTAVSLAQELLAAADEHRLPKYLKSFKSADLVVIDELGYLPLGPGGPLLFQFCAERYEAGSILVTSNLEFSRWSEIFGDATLTTALLDRLTHHSHILLFEGESYRFRQSKQRQRADGKKK
ncbi:MAG: AAA family ATPase [Actinobacteria bacterium]|nr:MAG: AAA family ATPase [Actinomycetota bacterium]